MSKQISHLQASNPRTPAPKPLVARTLGSKMIGRRQLLSTLALGSTALVGVVSLKNGTGVLGTGVLGTDKLNLHDTSVHGTSALDALIKPAAAQGEPSAVDFVLSFGGGDQSSLDVTFNIDESGRVIRTGYKRVAVDGTLTDGPNGPDRALIPLRWDDGSSLYLGVTETYSQNGEKTIRLIDAVDVGYDSDSVASSGVTAITVSANAETIPDANGNINGIAPRVISNSDDSKFATVLPVLYRAGPEVVITSTDPGTGLPTSLPSQESEIGRRFFAGYYVRLHDSATGWQYVPNAGGVNRDMQLEIPIVVDGEVQYAQLPPVEIANEEENPFLGTGYLAALQYLPGEDPINEEAGYDLGTTPPFLPSSEDLTDFDTALDATFIGEIPMDGGERVKDPTAITTFFSRLPVTPEPETPDGGNGINPGDDDSDDDSGDGINTGDDDSDDDSGDGINPGDDDSDDDSGDGINLGDDDSDDDSGDGINTGDDDSDDDSGDGINTGDDDSDDDSGDGINTGDDDSDDDSGDGEPTDIEAPGPTTSTVAPTTSTNVATTTMAATTMLVTTMAATTMAATTTASPGLPGDVLMQALSRVQADVGASVSRSLKSRLSIFRSRNRFN